MKLGGERERGIPVIDLNTPNRAFEGTRALTVQSYGEAASKLGKIHELSVLVENMSDGQLNQTIFLTGSLPVVLRLREASFTGAGVILGVYESPTYTGGVELTTYNATRISPLVSEAKFYSGATITDIGTQAFPFEYLIGNASNNGKGATGVQSDRRRVLKPNTAYNFTFESLDGNQDVSIFDAYFEGELDLPLEP